MEIKKKYIMNKAVAVMVITFLVFVFVLMISQMLAFTAFPIKGYFSYQISYNELMTPDKNRMLSYLETYYPNLNILSFILLRGAVAAAAALFSFSLTFINNIKKYTILLIPTILYILYTLIMGTISDKVEDMSLKVKIGTNMLNVNGYGSILVVLGFIGTLIFVSCCLIWRGIRDDEVLL